jgi:O-antigen/teichoic acid export membrane protein
VWRYRAVPVTDDSTRGGASPPVDVLSGDDVAGRVVRGGAVRLAGFVVTNLVATAATIVLLRHLGVEDFGRYGTVLALMTIVNGVTEAGLNLVGTREVALAPQGAPRRALTGAILGIRLVLTVLGAAAATLFAVLAGYDDAMVAGTVLAGIGVIGVGAQSALGIPAIVDLRNTALSVVEIARAVVLAVGIAALAVAGASLVPFLALQVAVGFLVLALYPVIFGRAILVRPRYDREQWIRVMRAALPVAIAGVLAVLYLRIVVVLASVTVDERETGLLVTSARIVEVIAGLPLILVGVILPVATVAARDNADRLRYIWQRLVEGGLILGALAALVLGFAAEPLVVLLGGREYEDASSVLAIQGAVLVTIFLIQASVVVLIATHRQLDIAKANLVGLAILILLPAHGATGGAIASLGADVVLALIMLSLVHRAGVGLQVGEIPKIVVAAGLAVGAGLIPGLGPVAATALAVTVFVGVCTATRALPPEVGVLVRGRLGRG